MDWEFWFDVEVTAERANMPGDDDAEGQLCVRVTDEGIILDLVDRNGEVIGTFGATAQELADDFVH